MSQYVLPSAVRLDLPPVAPKARAVFQWQAPADALLFNVQLTLRGEPPGVAKRTKIPTKTIAITKLTWNGVEIVVPPREPLPVRRGDVITGSGPPNAGRRPLGASITLVVRPPEIRPTGMALSRGGWIPETSVLRAVPSMLSLAGSWFEITLPFECAITRWMGIGTQDERVVLLGVGYGCSGQDATLLSFDAFAPEAELKLRTGNLPPGTRAYLNVKGAGVGWARVDVLAAPPRLLTG